MRIEKPRSQRPFTFFLQRVNVLRVAEPEPEAHSQHNIIISIAIDRDSAYSNRSPSAHIQRGIHYGTTGLYRLFIW